MWRIFGKLVQWTIEGTREIFQFQSILGHARNRKHPVHWSGSLEKDFTSWLPLDVCGLCLRACLLFVTRKMCRNKGTKEALEPESPLRSPSAFSAPVTQSVSQPVSSHPEILASFPFCIPHSLHRFLPFLKFFYKVTVQRWLAVSGDIISSQACGDTVQS